MKNIAQLNHLVEHFLLKITHEEKAVRIGRGVEDAVIEGERECWTRSNKEGNRREEGKIREEERPESRPVIERKANKVNPE